jgi:hypothetical protein
LYIDNTRRSDRRDQVRYSLFMSQAAWPHERPRNVIISFPVDVHSRKRTCASPPLSIEHPSPVKKRRYPRFRITPHRPNPLPPHLILTTNQLTMSSFHNIPHAAFSGVRGHTVEAAGNGQATVMVNGAPIAVSTDL